MAWVSLHQLLRPSKNLYGLIPTSATVIVEATDQSTEMVKITKKHRGNFGGKRIVSATEWSHWHLNKEDLSPGDEIALYEFCNKHTAFASNIEWRARPDGRLSHFSDRLFEDANPDGDKKYFHLHYLHLDLAPFLRSADDDTLLMYSCLTNWAYEPKENDYVIPVQVKTPDTKKYGRYGPPEAADVLALYERLGQTLPEDYAPVKFNKNVPVSVFQV